MSVDKELLALLVCPACRTEVTEAGDFLRCEECGRRYPVKDGIPVMIVEEALGPER